MTDPQREQVRRERIERIEYELTLPVQSQWIRDDVRFLLTELQRAELKAAEVAAAIEGSLDDEGAAIWVTELRSP